ncbi:LOB domain-containing protein 1-like [Cryptomeria japonica]|uniref:LOB domain-containing protein 1-like n=1 Tax=Cryptomeria japonica TaxID=3369 RepID=UPI0027D9D125|nr:LOB domain-containing protein 1-like [Cryptomeria japonica]
MAKRKRKVVSCAACRLQRKKCLEDCILAPHFPPDDPDKFTVVHRVYGTSYIIKLLQGLDTKQREDAINSLVCEANARVKDPIQGSSKVVHELQKRIPQLESQLVAKEEKLISIQSKYDKLLFLQYMGSPNGPHFAYDIDITEDIMYEQGNIEFSICHVYKKANKTTDVLANVRAVDGASGLVDSSPNRWDGLKGIKVEESRIGL